MPSNARLLRAAAFIALNILVAGPASAAGDPDNTLVMSLKCGDVVIDLRPDLAPKHVAQIKKLTRQGFYDGIVFHRVIDGFMAQTGDPTGTGTGGSKEPDLPAEFSNEHFARGTLGHGADATTPTAPTRQFFIMFADGGFLDGKYTVLGKVRSGMDCVDQINKGEPPATPDKIVRLKVQKDIK